MELRGAGAGLAQQTNYPVAPATPKEIGVLQRLDGVRSGVNEIEAQLRAFIERLHGSPAAAQAGERAYQPGIHGALSDTEASIRETFGMLQRLSDNF